MQAKEITIEQMRELYVRAEKKAELRAGVGGLRGDSHHFMFPGGEMASFSIGANFVMLRVMDRSGVEVKDIAGYVAIRSLPPL